MHPKAANQFDIVILGSGSTAFAAASRAAESGKAAAMTEARTLGGTCVNCGCLPSKNLIEAARILDESRNPRYPGLTAAPMALTFQISSIRKMRSSRITAARNTRASLPIRNAFAYSEGAPGFPRQEPFQG
jgi:mercuric reductase